MLTSLSVGRGGLGRMGNQMFTIAGTIGIAVRSGQPYGFPEWVNVDNANFGGAIDNLNNELVKPLPPIPEGVNWQEYPYFWGYRDITLPTGNWNIHAHLQCDRYFNHCMPLIRETFRFTDEPQQNDYVAIHYRAGDYQEGEDCYHPRCSNEYYEKALEHFAAGSQCLVFSDDINAACEIFKGKNFLYRSSSSYIEDFKVLKRCKSFITANSSFSLMAAILGEHPDKKIICPSRWFGKSWGTGYKELSKDVYPEKSIVI